MPERCASISVGGVNLVVLITPLESAASRPEGPSAIGRNLTSWLASTPFFLQDLYDSSVRCVTTLGYADNFALQVLDAFELGCPTIE
jgi:hypothetical protein